MSTPLAKPGWIEYLGQPQLYSDAITMKTASGNKPQMTNLLGLAGKSDGATVMSLDVKSAVPQAGFELDVIGLCALHTQVVLAFKLAGYRTEIDGWIDDASVSTSAEGQTELSFTFTGALLSHTQI